MEAYVLIQTEVGQAPEVAREVRTLGGGVVVAEVVVGPYDVVVRVQAENVDALGKQVVSRLQLINGVVRTLTCPIIHL
jgi:DNA-binding Lrp family transcriptional regulator